jgi:hypothetical protein
VPQVGSLKPHPQLRSCMPLTTLDGRFGMSLRGVGAAAWVSKIYQTIVCFVFMRIFERKSRPTSASGAATGCSARQQSRKPNASAKN